MRNVSSTVGSYSCFANEKKQCHNPEFKCFEVAYLDEMVCAQHHHQRALADVRISNQCMLSQKLKTQPTRVRRHVDAITPSIDIHSPVICEGIQPSMQYNKPASARANLVLRSNHRVASLPRTQQASDRRQQPQAKGSCQAPTGTNPNLLLPRKQRTPGTLSPLSSVPQQQASPPRSRFVSLQT